MFALLTFAQPVIAQAPILPPEPELITKEDMVDYLEKRATERQLSANQTAQAMHVISCESTWNPNAVGDNFTSYGLAQIHLPAHPNISKEEALDPRFAIDFLLEEFSGGRQWKWTCWRKYYA